MCAGAGDRLGLDVIDHYQGGEAAGGQESFRRRKFYGQFGAGFGIVENVQSSHPYDSLFLDEGFGTLDEEALNTTLDALSRLERENKLIGIISHVAAFKGKHSDPDQ